MATRTKPKATRKPATAAARRPAAASKTSGPARPLTAADTQPAAKSPPAPASATSRSAPAPVPPPPTVSERARRGDLLDAVAERSPMRRADLKVVMDLVLEEMGRMIDEGDEAVLPPLGKLVVKKRVPRGDGGDMLTVKLKRRPAEGATDGFGS